MVFLMSDNQLLVFSGMQIKYQEQGAAHNNIPKQIANILCLIALVSYKIQPVVSRKHDQ
jgi:hypothetical protein